MGYDLIGEASYEQDFYKKTDTKIDTGGYISSDDFVLSLKKRGIKIGENCKFFDPNSNVIDVTRPYLLEIGNRCKITHGVIILTHDFSYSVLRIVYGDLLASCSKTVIGDNCFIGMNAIIMPGVTIGNNVIIGCGSVVTTKSIPDNSVWAGNPAKQICTLDEFYDKRKIQFEKDAIITANAFYARYNRMPTIKEMESFFPLYLDRKRELLESNHLKTDLSGDDSEAVIEAFFKSSDTQKYESFEEFLKHAIHLLDE